MELRTTLKGPMYPDIPPLCFSFKEKGEVVQLVVAKALMRWHGGICDEARRFVADCKDATRKELIWFVEKYVHVTWH